MIRPADVELDGCSLYCGDVLDVLPGLDAESVDLVFADPPYNIGKAAWDKVPDYLDWCGKWIAECSRVLKPNGAFWVSHSKPLVLAKLSELIAGHGRGLVNWVTWDKYGEGVESPMKGFMDGFTLIGTVRSWQPMSEYLIFHADEGDWTAQCDRERGFIFEPLRAYLAGERERAGWTTRRVAEALQQKTGSRTVTGMAGHWFERVQWSLPTAANYEWLRRLFNADSGEDLRREYEYLRREYEDLRKQFESLRYTFNNPGKMSSVWQIPPAKPNGHPTPKPEELLRRIIEATSNPGDVVLDPFLGSGTTAAVCQQTGRLCIGVERDPKYIEAATRRITPPPLLRAAHA